MSKSLDKIIKKYIRQEVETELSRQLAPLEVLRKYDDVETLTLEEVAQVLRVNERLIKDAAKRGEIPSFSFGQQIRFPKVLIAKVLLGIWKPEKKKKTDIQYNRNSEIERMARELVAD